MGRDSYTADALDSIEGSAWSTSVQMRTDTFETHVSW
jgi:hypothetical protein